MPKGFKHSAETREKMRQAKLGKPGNANGFKHSDEFKEKIRQAKLGVPRSEAARAAISAGKLGKPLSEETKRKIKESWRKRVREGNEQGQKDK